MEGDQWPPPLTPLINQQDLSSSYLYNTNSSIPSSSSMNFNNNLLHPQMDRLSNTVMDGDQEIIDWVNLLSQTGCSTSTSTAAYNNPHDSFLTPSCSSSRLVGSEDHHDHQGKNKSLDDVTKVGRKAKKVVPPRVAFHTRSQDDILDDGYKWRKYGQKAVKNCNYPRSYYQCTRHTCNVKKQIQRLSKDPAIVVTTYEGIHNHPCEQFMETISPLLNQIQFLTKF